MHWIVQNNLFREAAVERLHGVLERLGLPSTTVRGVPFEGRVDPELEIEGPVVVVGSVALVRYALRKGWTPGGWADEEPFTFARCLEAFGSEMLNADAVQCRFGNVVGLSMDEFFVRPQDDGKLFAGEVMTVDGFGAWAERIADADSTWTVTSDTPVVVAPVKEILSETRFVVVGGRIVTGSLYRRGGRGIHDGNVPSDILAWAQERASRWTPAEACAMDVAETPDGYRIIEFNNLNSAGWYECDVGRIVTAIEERFGRT